VTPDRVPTSVVAVVSGDTIVGKALQLLLQGAGFSVRFLVGPSFDEPGLLDEVQLLLLAPGLSPKRRDALLELINRRPLAARIPVLELLDNSGATQAEDGHFIPWPCRAEELKRQITAALLARSEAARDE
jgi:hypothetical protein